MLRVLELRGAFPYGRPCDRNPQRHLPRRGELVGRMTRGTRRLGGSLVMADLTPARRLKGKAPVLAF
jgi:hypothetical protein